MVSSVSSATASSVLDSYLQKQTTTTAADKSAQDSLTKLSGDYNTFLKLLTVQAQYQDPLAPNDPTEYTKQLVSYSQVEQQISTNKKLEQLVGLNSKSSVGNLLGYIGKYVEADTGNNLSLQGGKAQIAYTLPTDAANTDIIIKNKSGTEVARFAPSGTAGKHILTWDGTSSGNVKLADGNYTFTLSATNSTGTTITPSALTTLSRVTGVANGSNGAELSSGDLVLKESGILSIREATNG